MSQLWPVVEAGPSSALQRPVIRELHKAEVVSLGLVVSALLARIRGGSASRWWLA